MAGVYRACGQPALSAEQAPGQREAGRLPVEHREFAVDHHCVDDPRVAVVDDVGDEVDGRIVQKTGLSMTGSVDFKLAAFDFSAQVSRLKAAPSDLVGVGVPPEAAIKLAQEMRRQRHTGRLVASSTISDPDLRACMGREGNGTVIIPTTFFADLNERTRKFAAEFARRAKAANLERTPAGQFDAAT